jgi:hypothetical protein
VLDQPRIVIVEETRCSCCVRLPTRAEASHRPGEVGHTGEPLRLAALDELCRRRHQVTNRSKIRSKSFRHDAP